MSYKGLHTDPEILDQKKQSEMARTKFPKIFKEQVSMDKVNRGVIEKWVETEINTLVPGDEILIEYIKNLIDSPKPDIRDVHLQLTSFLEDATLSFTTRLWQLLLDAQKDPDGIPSELVKAREIELAARQKQMKEMDEANKLKRTQYHGDAIKSHNKWVNQSHRVSKVDRNRRNKNGYPSTRAPSGAKRLLHDTYTPRAYK